MYLIYEEKQGVRSANEKFVNLTQWDMKCDFRSSEWKRTEGEFCIAENAQKCIDILGL